MGSPEVNLTRRSTLEQWEQFVEAKVVNNELDTNNLELIGRGRAGFWDRCVHEFGKHILRWDPEVKQQHWVDVGRKELNKLGWHVLKKGSHVNNGLDSIYMTVLGTDTTVLEKGRFSPEHKKLKSALILKTVRQELQNDGQDQVLTEDEVIQAMNSSEAPEKSLREKIQDAIVIKQRDHLIGRFNALGFSPEIATPITQRIRERYDNYGYRGQGSVEMGQDSVLRTIALGGNSTAFSGQVYIPQSLANDHLLEYLIAIANQEQALLLHDFAQVMQRIYPEFTIANLSTIENQEKFAYYVGLGGVQGVGDARGEFELIEKILKTIKEDKIDKEHLFSSVNEMYERALIGPLHERALATFVRGALAKIQRGQMSTEQVLSAYHLSDPQKEIARNLLEKKEGEDFILTLLTIRINPAVVQATVESSILETIGVAGPSISVEQLSRFAPIVQDHFHIYYALSPEDRIGYDTLSTIYGRLQEQYFREIDLVLKEHLEDTGKTLQEIGLMPKAHETLIAARCKILAVCDQKDLQAEEKRELTNAILENYGFSKNEEELKIVIENVSFIKTGALEKTLRECVEELRKQEIQRFWRAKLQGRGLGEPLKNSFLTRMSSYLDEEATQERQQALLSLVDIIAKIEKKYPELEIDDIVKNGKLFLDSQGTDLEECCEVFNAKAGGIGGFLGLKTTLSVQIEELAFLGTYFDLLQIPSEERIEIVRLIRKLFPGDLNIRAIKQGISTTLGAAIAPENISPIKYLNRLIWVKGFTDKGPMVGEKLEKDAVAFFTAFENPYLQEDFGKPQTDVLNRLAAIVAEIRNKNTHYPVADIIKAAKFYMDNLGGSTEQRLLRFNEAKDRLEKISQICAAMVHFGFNTNASVPIATGDLFSGIVQGLSDHPQNALNVAIHLIKPMLPSDKHGDLIRVINTISRTPMVGPFLTERLGKMMADIQKSREIQMALRFADSVGGGLTADGLYNILMRELRIYLLGENQEVGSFARAKDYIRSHTNIPVRAMELELNTERSPAVTHLGSVGTTLTKTGVQFLKGLYESRYSILTDQLAAMKRINPDEPEFNRALTIARNNKELANLASRSSEPEIQVRIRDLEEELETLGAAPVVVADQKKAIQLRLELDRYESLLGIPPDPWRFHGVSYYQSKLANLDAQLDSIKGIVSDDIFIRAQRVIELQASIQEGERRLQVKPGDEELQRQLTQLNTELSRVRISLEGARELTTKERNYLRLYESRVRFTLLILPTPSDPSAYLRLIEASSNLSGSFVRGAIKHTINLLGRGVLPSLMNNMFIYPEVINALCTNGQGEIDEEAKAQLEADPALKNILLALTTKGLDLLSGTHRRAIFNFLKDVAEYGAGAEDAHTPEQLIFQLFGMIENVGSDVLDHLSTIKGSDVIGALQERKANGPASSSS